MTLEQIVKIVTTVLDPYATDNDRMDVAELFFDQLPDGGDAVFDVLGRGSFVFQGRNGYETDKGVEQVYAAYGVERDI